MKIAIIDDNETMGEVLSQMLKINDHDCDFYRRGISFINSIDFDYDLILIDMLLPDILGTSLIMEIRQRHIDATIIVMSVDLNQQLLSKVHDMGISFFLQKPFKFEVLKEIICYVEKNNKLISDFTHIKKSSKHVLLITNGSNFKITNNDNVKKVRADEMGVMQETEGLFLIEHVNINTLSTFFDYFLDNKLFLKKSKFILRIDFKLDQLEVEIKNKPKLKSLIKTHSYIFDV